MKKIALLFVVLVFITTVSFSQTAVSVPNNFVGTWWIDISDQLDAPDGLQCLASAEFLRDGTWITRVKFVAYNLQGQAILAEMGFTNGYTIIAESGVVIAATSVEIALVRLGESQVYDRFKVDGNALVDMNGIKWTKEEPRPNR